MNEQKIDRLLTDAPSVINIGLEGFADDLAIQGADVIQVNWSPPGAGNSELAALLSKLVDMGNTGMIEAANEEAVTRMLSADPVLVDVIPAAEAIPNLKERMRQYQSKLA